MTLLSKEAPKTICFPACSMSAVSSTTTGGLPGPAVMARLPERIASVTTPPPPVTSRSRTMRMAHQRLRAFDGRLGGGGNQVRGAARPQNRLVEEADGPRRHGLGLRVDVEGHGVARAQDRDGVVDDGAGGVGRGGDGADDAEGRTLHQGQPVRPAPRLGFQDFRPGGLFRDQLVLENLVLGAPQAGFLGGFLGQGAPVLAHAGTHGRDDPLARFQRHRLVLLERGPGRAHRSVHLAKDAKPLGIHRPRRSAAAARPLRGLLHDGLDLPGRKGHGSTLLAPVRKGCRCGGSGRETRPPAGRCGGCLWAWRCSRHSRRPAPSRGPPSWRRR